VASIEDRLRDIERQLSVRARSLERAHDSRCVFTHAYALMTTQIVKELPSRKSIDAAWITQLGEAFASRYFNVLDSERVQLPDSWAYAFEVMANKRTSVLEDLIFAMAVHIMHDLPLALRDVSGGGQLDSTHIDDFHAVNDMMASSIETIVNTTAKRYAPYVRWLDRMGGHYDNILTDYGIRMSRGLAWYNAVRLGDAKAAGRAQGSVERSPIEFVENIARPPVASVRVLLRILRWLVSFLRTWPDEQTQRGMSISGTA
jgi:hypothetical protein